MHTTDTHTPVTADQGPCSNPDCACGPGCNCGPACVCTPAANCAQRAG
jgi:hypothetical protein